jgi:hypothetical protein
MDWKVDKPSPEFVGFAIECRAPGDGGFFALENRLSFLAADGSVDHTIRSTKLSALQTFRWVHFPHDADLNGEGIRVIAGVRGPIPDRWPDLHAAADQRRHSRFGSLRLSRVGSVRDRSMTDRGDSHRMSALGGLVDDPVAADAQRPEPLQASSKRVAGVGLTFE